MSQHQHGPPFHHHHFNQPTIPTSTAPSISHHHHSRLFYFLTDPNLTNAQTILQAQRQLSRPQLTIRPPQPQNTLPGIPMAIAAVDDCCAECCPMAARSDVDREQMLCKWLACSATFNTLDDLAPHLFKIHLGGRTIDLKCHWESCTVSTEDSNDLFNHLTKHLGQFLHYCRWLNCRDRFETFDELTGHLSDTHVGSGRSEYICRWEKCDREGKVFSQRQKVIRHIQTHTGDKPYQCSMCKKRFSEANIITQHLRTHTGEKPYKCPEKGCEKQFSISGALTIHRRVHSGEKPFACKYQGCEKKFSESSNLTKHVSRESIRAQTHTHDLSFPS
ncbi:hypothetical protein CLU79DRAFT_701387 [Phycomyces nitens]|nr:hypothetical protein CLU79DRAFT_701387 [Phycomyces nitens]